MKNTAQLITDIHVLLNIYEQALRMPMSRDMWYRIEPHEWIFEFYASCKEQVPSLKKTSLSAREQQKKRGDVLRNLLECQRMVQMCYIGVTKMDRRIIPQELRKQKGEDVISFFTGFFLYLKVLDFPKFFKALALLLPQGVLEYEEDFKKYQSVEVSRSSREEIARLSALRTALMGNLRLLGFSGVEVRKALSSHC